MAVTLPLRPPDQASPRRAPSLPAEDGAQEDAQHRARQARVEGELVAHRHRHGEDPLADGHGRQDAIDEVGSELAHAPPAARRTETAPTTAEGHHGRVPAALTLHAQQTVFEPATLEVRLELAPHERRPAACPVLRGRAREERREVRRDRPVEHGLLGLAALIGRPGTRDRAHGPAGEQGPCRDGARAHTPMRTRGCPVAPLRRPRAILFPKGYRVTATGSVWTGPVGAADACVHPHAQHRLRNGQSLQCQPGFGWKTPASIAWRTSAIRSSPRSFVLLNRSSPL